MITKAEVKDLVDQAEKKLSEVTDILIDIESKRETERLFEIQPILAETLYDLSCMYSNLSHEKNEYIERKSSLDTSWFTNRMQLIDKYQSAINYCISIGKFLGDHFAWIFYYKDRDTLHEHYQHERIFHMPTGTGGLGEREFAKNIKFVDGKVLIYHGITSFLRLGDVSFFDPKNSTVSSIGEIKTKKIDENELSISLSLVGTQKEGVRVFDELIEKQEGKGAKNIKPLSQKIRNKLDGQLSKISKSLGAERKTKKEDFQIDFEFEKIEKLYENTTSSGINLIKVSDGHLLGCYRPSERSLFTKFFNDYSKSIKEKGDLDEAFIKQIFIPDSEYNQLLIGDVFNPVPESYLQPSATPLLFWPISSNFFKEIVLHDAVFFSFYNPAHLIKKLKKADFEIKKYKTRFFKVLCKIDDSYLQFESLNHYIHLITKEFYSEESIVKIFKRIRKNAHEGKIKRNQRMPIDIQTSL